jgi:hypothetical protein
MKKLIPTITLSILLGIQLIFASVQSDIEAANKAGKYVFLVVTEKGNPNNAAALKISQDAQKLYQRSTVIELNRTDKANEKLVIKYKLESADLPLILVIATNGADAGGTAYLKQTTAQELVDLIPSPKKAEVLKSMGEGKSVFLVVSRKSMSKNKVLENCKKACSDMKDNARIVEVDFDDAAEKKFLESLNITKIGNEPDTYVINTTGAINNTYTGVTDVNTLKASATKKVGGCCAPGSGKTCAPAKK